MGGGYSKNIRREGICSLKHELTKAIALPGAIDLITTLQDINGKWGIVTSGTSGTPLPVQQ